MTKDGKVIGIVSRRDVLQPLSALVREPLSGSASDASILQQIERDLAAQPWSPRHNISVKVEDGVISLSGTVSGFEQREALQVLIADIPGVRRIHDQLLVVNPYMDTATLSPIEIRRDREFQ